MDWKAFLEQKSEVWDLKLIPRKVFVAKFADENKYSNDDAIAGKVNVSKAAVKKNMTTIYRIASKELKTLKEKQGRGKFEVLRKYLKDEWKSLQKASNCNLDVSETGGRLADSSERLDWEKAVARILCGSSEDDIQNRVVGTGFLIAPAYVLTCAHVVSQLLDIEDFTPYQAPPKQAVTLDFPVGSESCEMQAEVVDWQPDVVVLRLKDALSVDAIPLPIASLPSGFGGDRYSVYGFGNFQGDILDDFSLRALSAGNRLQLQKTEQPEGESIKAGYRGAPVRHNREGRVIGMIATVEEGRADGLSKVFVMTREILEPVLKKVSALYLEDVLVRGLASCAGDEQKRRLELAISQTLNFCNPNADLEPDPEARTRKAQLCVLAIDQLPPESWAVEGKLVWFVMQLVMKKKPQKTQLIPQPVLNALKDWVNHQGLDYPSLLARSLDEISEQLTAQLEKKNLIVVLRELQGDAETLEVSMWAVADRDTYDLSNPPEYSLFNQETSIHALPELIRCNIRKTFRTSKPVVHLFVPPALLGRGFEMQAISAKRRKGLGCDYHFVLRVNFDDHPKVRSAYYKEVWEEKWSRIETVLSESVVDVFEPVNCSLSESDLLDALEPISAAILENTHDVDVAELFSAAVDEEIALPAALWVRSSACPTLPCTVLDGVSGQLLERIRQERESAYQSGQTTAALGYNLSLVWEDPKIVPPTTMASIGLEAC